MEISYILDCTNQARQLSSQRIQKYVNRAADNKRSEIKIKQIN